MARRVRLTHPAVASKLRRALNVYAATTDASFNQPVHMTGGVGMGPADTVRGAILTINTAHNNEHYGKIVVYLPLKGHVPPSTARQQTKK